MRRYFTINQVILFILLLPLFQADACRMWGLVWTDANSLPTNEAYSDIINRTLVPTIEGIWENNNWDGWSICWYDENDSLRITRGNAMPWTGEDDRWIASDEGPVIDSLIYNCPDVAFMHLRLASTGSDDDANPHPFFYNLFDQDYAFQHNGTISGSNWIEVMEDGIIGQNYIDLPLFAQRRYINHGSVGDVVDSEYLGVAYMKNILIAANYDKNINWAIKQTAKDVIRADFISGNMFNFNSINGLLCQDNSIKGITIPNSDSYNLWYRIFEDIPGKPCVILNWNPDTHLWNKLHESNNYEILSMFAYENPDIEYFNILNDLTTEQNEFLNVTSIDPNFDLAYSAHKYPDNKFLLSWYTPGFRTLYLREYNQMGLAEQNSLELNLNSAFEEVSILAAQDTTDHEELYIFSVERLNNTTDVLKVYDVNKNGNSLEITGCGLLSEAIEIKNPQCYLLDNNISLVSWNSANFHTQASNIRTAIHNHSSGFLVNIETVEGFGNIVDSEMIEDDLLAILTDSGDMSSLLLYQINNNQVLIKDTLSLEITAEIKNLFLTKLSEEELSITGKSLDEDSNTLHFSHVTIGPDFTIETSRNYYVELPISSEFSLGKPVHSSEELEIPFINEACLYTLSIDPELECISLIETLLESAEHIPDNARLSSVYYPETGDWPERQLIIWSNEGEIEENIYGYFSPDHFASDHDTYNRFFTESPAPHEISSSDLIPKDFKIKSVYPNPFNSFTNIVLELPYISPVKLDVYTINGRLIGTILNRTLSSGTHTLPFPGNSLSSGSYYLRLNSPQGSQVKQIYLIR